MKALLLAAGLGTRLRPLTNSTPKCLVPIAGRPLLDYWLHSLFSSGVERILINTHYHEDRVLSFLYQSRYREFIDTTSEPQLLGTAGTVANNLEYFDGESFLVAHADNFCSCEFTAFIAAHLQRPAYTTMTMMTFHAPDPKQCGVVSINEERVVEQFFEKVDCPPSDLANAAVYILENVVGKFCEGLSEETPDISLNVVPHFLGRIFTWHNMNYHMDIGTPGSYTAANEKMVELTPKIDELGWFSSVR